jgi:putative oxidoreductase
MSGQNTIHNRNWMNGIVATIAVLIGFVLIYSASVHLSNPYAFLSNVYSYHVVSERIGVAVGVFLPCLQITVGLALLFYPRLRPSSFAIATLLFLVFAGLQIQANVRGLNISCGCFSNSKDDPISAFTIGRVIILAIVSGAGAAVLYLSNSHSKTTSKDLSDQANLEAS